MAAAIYIHRAGIEPLVLERGQQGGLLRNANLVENYPGFPGGIRGQDLVDRFSKQLATLGISVTKASVRTIGRFGDVFRIKSDSGNFSARSVIVAAGTSPCTVRLRGGKELLGNTVFDELMAMPLETITNKHVIVIGGGDAAFDYGLNLLSRGCRVSIVSRSEPRCLSLLRARAEAGGIDLHIGPDPKLVKSGPSGILLSCREGKSMVEYSADYLLLACGREPNLGVLSPVLRRTIKKSSSLPETIVPGLYLAGDVARGKQRQTGIAVGDGIRAGMMIVEYLRQGADAR